MTRRSIPIIPAIACVLLLGGSGFALSAVIKTQKLHLQKLPINAPEGRKIHTLPKKYPTWEMVAQNNEMSEEAIAELGTDNFISASFERAEGEDAENQPREFVDLHVAYYTGMIDTVPHVPERCLVAAGLQQVGEPSLVHVPLNFNELVKNPEADPEVMGGDVWGGRSPVTFRRVNLPAGIDHLEMRVTPFRDNQGRMLYAGYFFVTNGQTVSSADAIRLRAFRLTDDYAYYAKVQFTSMTATSPEDLGQIAGSMLDEIFPDLMYRMPDWVEVKAGRYPASGSASAKTESTGE